MARHFYAPEGTDAAAFEPGDFLLTRGDYWSSRLIRLGQRLRFPKEFVRYNHAALVVDADGSIVEALGQGVVRRHVSEYRPRNYYLVKIEASDEDREQIVRYAESVLAARHSYGWLTIASVALTLLTGSALVFARSGSSICSGFVSEGLVRAGYVFDKPPAFMTPADLAKFFDIDVPIGGDRG